MMTRIDSISDRYKVDFEFKSRPDPHTPELTVWDAFLVQRDEARTRTALTKLMPEFDTCVAETLRVIEMAGITKLVER